METYSSRRRRSAPKSLKIQGDEPTLDDLVEAASIMTDKREEKVKRVFFHQGVHLGTSVPNSVDTEKDQAEIVMCHHGVRITLRNRHFVVPISVITSIELFAPGQ
jgi:hypothetical protein